MVKANKLVPILPKNPTCQNQKVQLRLENFNYLDVGKCEKVKRPPVYFTKNFVENQITARETVHVNCNQLKKDESFENANLATKVLRTDDNFCSAPKNIATTKFSEKLLEDEVDDTVQKLCTKKTELKLCKSILV